MLTGWCGGGSGACCAALRSARLEAPISGPRRTPESPGGNDARPEVGPAGMWLGATEGLVASASLILSCRGCRETTGVLAPLLDAAMAP